MSATEVDSGLNVKERIRLTHDHKFRWWRPLKATVMALFSVSSGEHKGLSLGLLRGTVRVSVQSDPAAVQEFWRRQVLVAGDQIDSFAVRAWEK